MTTTSENDRFEVYCPNCEIRAVLEITQNPIVDGCVLPMLEDGGWTCFNCASQRMGVIKL